MFQNHRLVQIGCSLLLACAESGSLFGADNVASTPRKRALLVGSANYGEALGMQLSGPTNDVKLLRATLLARGFDAKDITILADDVPDAAGRPTRKNIADKFIELGTSASPNDQIVILLSGHGSQQPNVPDPKRPDPDDEDGLDETYLPVDVGPWQGDRQTVANAIVDDEFFDWTQAMTKKGAFVWIIFDCCHSGDGIRGDLGEVAREVSPAKLGAPAPAKVIRDLSATTKAAWDTSEPVKNLVVFYACQSADRTYERPMPYMVESGLSSNTTAGAAPATSKQATHGLFTYTLCKLLREPAGAERSYRDLVAAVWAQYRAWGRLNPTPYVDGHEADLAVLGTARPRRRYPLSPVGENEWSIPAGELDGLTLHSVLAVHSSEDASEKRPLGHIVITRLGAADARLEQVQRVEVTGLPTQFKKIALPDKLPDGCYAVISFLDYGDMRLTVSVDSEQPGLAASERTRLEQLRSELNAIAVRPAAVFRIAPNAADAVWLIQFRDGKPTLVNRSLAMSKRAEPLPKGTSKFIVPASQSAEALAAHLEKVFRAHNLVRICRPANESANQRFGDAVAVQIEMIRYRDAAGNEPKVMHWDRGPPNLHPGEWVGWKVTNASTLPVDITLLYVDADYTIQSVFPPERSVGANNRLSALPPRNTFQTRPIQVTNTPLGTEQLVVVALKGLGPPKDYRMLAQTSLEKAKSLELQMRSPDDNVTFTPLGRLLSHAVFHESLEGGEGLRGVNVDSDGAPPEHALYRMTWNTVAK